MYLGGEEVVMSTLVSCILILNIAAFKRFLGGQTDHCFPRQTHQSVLANCLFTGDVCSSDSS